MVSCLDRKAIAGYEFNAFGAHHDGFPVAYVTFACALGMQRGEVDLLVTKLRKTIHEWRTKRVKAEIAVSMTTSEGLAHENGK